MNTNDVILNLIDRLIQEKEKNFILQHNQQPNNQVKEEKTKKD